MATTLQYRINGGEWLSGGGYAAVGSTCELRSLESAGSYRFEVYAFPVGGEIPYTGPSGWQYDADRSCYYFLGASPPSFPLSVWGKWLFSLIRNKGLSSGVADALLTDSSSGVAALSEGGLEEVGHWEQRQFGGWDQVINRNLRALSGVPSWHTLLDTDFTALEGTDVAADGDVVLDGVTWTKQGSANQKATALINSLGLRFYPQNSSTSGMYSEAGFPGLVGVHTSLAALGVPSLRTPLRMLMRTYAPEHAVVLRAEFGMAHVFSPTTDGAPSGVAGSVYLDRPDATFAQAGVWRGQGTWGVDLSATGSDFMGSTGWDVYGVDAPLGLAGAMAQATMSPIASGWPDGDGTLVGDTVRRDSVVLTDEAVSEAQMISAGSISDNWRLYLLSASGYTGGASPYVQYMGVRLQAYY